MSQDEQTPGGNDRDLDGSQPEAPASPPPCTRHAGLGLDRGPTGATPTGTTRRTFLKCAAIGTAGIIAGPRLLLPHVGRAAERAATGGSPVHPLSKVVRTFHPDATSGWTTINQDAVDLMVHGAVRELTGVQDTGAAWKSLFPGITADKRVSIKINLACGDVPTHPEIINAVIDGLRMMDLGGQQLPEEHIIVWDLDNAFLCPQTGYPQNWGGPGVQYVGTDHPSVGFDYSQTFAIQHPHSSTTYHHPSRLITEYSDYIINAAVIKDHSDSAVTLCLKNVYGMFDGIAVYELHTHGYYGDGHTRGEPELNRVLRDELGDKVKLFLVDGTFGLYDGGPGYVPPYHTPPNWAYNSLLAGIDPVAVDRIGTVKLNEERATHPGPPPPLDPSHVTAAAQVPYNLGTDNLAEIDLVELDVSGPAGVGATEQAPSGAVLLAPYPNPTQGSSTFRFRCGNDADAELRVVDVQGRLVRHLAAGRYARGQHELRWDGRNGDGRAVASGVYFFQLRLAGGVQRRSLVVVR